MEALHRADRSAVVGKGGLVRESTIDDWSWVDRSLLRGVRGVPRDPREIGLCRHSTRGAGNGRRDLSRRRCRGLLQHDLQAPVLAGHKRPGDLMHGSREVGLGAVVRVDGWRRGPDQPRECEPSRRRWRRTEAVHVDEPPQRRHEL